MVVKYFFLMIALFHVSKASAQLESLKITAKQLQEIYLLSDKTNNLTAGSNQIEKIKTDLLTLNSMSIQDINGIVKILEPKEIKSVKLKETTKANVKAFAEQFYSNRAADFQQVFKQYQIVQNEIAIKNFKQLVINEMYLLLSKDKLMYDGNFYTKESIEQMAVEGKSYDVYYKILNQNVNDKEWDAKSNFVFNNANQPLFR